MKRWQLLPILCMAGAVSVLVIQPVLAFEAQVTDVQLNPTAQGIEVMLETASDREVELPNTIELPSYVRADAAIFYRRDNYRFAINFKNISDTRYYGTQGFYITPAAPFTVLGTFSLEF